VKKWIAPAVAMLLPAAAIAAPPIDGDRLTEMVRTLASEPFQGRAPGTPGEEKTVTWLVERLKALGLEPGGRDGSWTQPVPLVRTQLGAGTISVAAKDATTKLGQGEEIYVSTVRPVDRVAIANAPMVFVGYGVSAPERGWNDFKGVDLKGKVAVFLVNDPDFEATGADAANATFGGKRMTYYGRWTYKYEEAARRGAVAALIVHDTLGAGYGWETVRAPAGENYDIVRANPNEKVLLQGWLRGDAATAMFSRAGLDLAGLRKQAQTAAFRPVPLTGLTFNADLPVKLERVESRNVLARIGGAKHPDETVMFGAHWDAYGVGAPDAQGRTVRPGANDDAAGVAGLLELARAFKAGPKPDRSLVFAFWTGEERGLLGSEAYAVDPVYPAAKTVANLTLDILQTGGPSRDVLLVGPGQDSLEDDLARAVKAQGRVITPEALPERGLFYRADHFSLARRGVPTLLLMAISGAPDLVKGGRAAGEAWLKDYMACYHQTGDVVGPTWDARGAADDVALFYTVAKNLAFSRAWPTWRAESEFKAVRDESAAERK
jgi:Zn-dependent M28 family amino/carboxypeptidase